MDWETTYIHSDNAQALSGEIASLCNESGWELVSVVHDGTRFHAFFKKHKSEDWREGGPR